MSESQMNQRGAAGRWINQSVRPLTNDVKSPLSRPVCGALRCAWSFGRSGADANGFAGAE